MKNIKIEGTTFLVNDAHSKAILHNNKAEIEQYHSNKNNNNKIKKMEKDINNLKTEIDSLKLLIMSVVKSVVKLNKA